ncbi:M20 metallopeptidase family protein [Caldalkalibacillus salinus]|uniref:M20 metallopeptidase family protein n=1 Tax=Caldalkalibacillus salinus TaxID=2803787 RepID=UPI001920528B|nr:M20 family metallopeptidase [Caldalkalibacillus salinus]
MHETAQKAQQLKEKLVSIRRALHAHPELSFNEINTAKTVAQALRDLGMEVTTDVAKTGVVGRLSRGEGPTIALRADMDALPIQEQNDVSYRSQNSGVMHACGHDAHTTILLGAAELLTEAFKQHSCEGTVKFIFQPAEENPDDKGLTGAPYMIQEGVLEDVDAVIALHMCPWEPVGHVQLNDGYSMANVDIFHGSVIGTGGHAAYPHLSHDPIRMLGPVLQSLMSIVGRRVTPMEPSVVSVTQIQTGSASNVIPTEVNISGTIRSYGQDVREQLISEVEKAFSLTRSLGGDYTFLIERGEPALYNHASMNTLLQKVIQSIYPNFQKKFAPFGLGGEDFGYMTRVVPGAMFFLGCALQDGHVRDLHAPDFDIDEDCLPIGAAILTETVKWFLQGKGHSISGESKGVTVDGA